MEQVSPQAAKGWIEDSSWVKASKRGLMLVEELWNLYGTGSPPDIWHWPL